MVAEHPGRGRAHPAVRGDRLVDHGPQRGGVPVGHEERPVEDLVQLVGADVAHGPLDGDVHLAAEHPGRVGVGVGEAPPAAVQVVHALLVPVRRLLLGPRRQRRAGERREGRVLDQAVADVDPEPVDAAVEPEAEHVVEVGQHLRRGPVEVGLGGVEEVQVPLAVGDLGPGAAAEDGQPVGRLVAEEVARAFRGARPGGERRDEPGVGRRRVVGHHVDDHAEAQRVRPLEQGVEVGERAEQRVDAAEVADVVAAVDLRRRVERREPDRVDAERGDGVEPRGDARQVAEPVTVAVGERARVDLVDDRRAPPGAAVGQDGSAPLLRAQLRLTARSFGVSITSPTMVLLRRGSR